MSSLYITVDSDLSALICYSGVVKVCLNCPCVLKIPAVVICPGPDLSAHQTNHHEDPLRLLSHGHRLRGQPGHSYGSKSTHECSVSLRYKIVLLFLLSRWCTVTDTHWCMSACSLQVASASSTTTALPSSRPMKFGKSRYWWWPCVWF